MCGITGFWDPSLQYNTETLEAVVKKMSNEIIHRGPDDYGAWVDERCGLALGFCRLAILDLTPAGRQPMSSADNRFKIIYNGEIYNHEELRQELSALGHSFRGHSDTEVMLAAFVQWGIIPAVKRFNGMFAFALWDSQDRQLYLGRDRIGIKPLYYGWLNGVFAFGSELKTLRVHPAFQCEINRNALALLLRHNYITAPHSIYTNISKLKQGCILQVNAFNRNTQLTPYWSALEIAEYGYSHPFEGNVREAEDQLDALLRESVRLRMIADVPLGAFLSGGIDSSTIVAMMQAQSTIPVKTFSIGFWEKPYDEAQHARAVAKHLGTDHTELYVTPKEAMEVIPRLPTLYDEPYSDSSQIPTFLVAQLARQHVTVSLSGDGGDELFAGYPRYTFSNTVWRWMNWLPQSVRRALAGMIGLPSVEQWRTAIKTLEPVLPHSLRQTMVADKIPKLRAVMACKDGQEVYKRLISHWMSPENVVIGGREPITVVNDSTQWPAINAFVPWMMALDLVSYLPDDILVKVDRASMGVSLEARVPLLDDHRVVEFAWRLPLSMKVRHGQSKWLLRQVLYRYVPPALIERPKMGFGVPIDHWLRGPLREWAEALLDEHRLEQEGYFHTKVIREAWENYLAGWGNWHYHLWDILMFQAWLDSVH
ncbi:MAG: asparagine synthase (glutamine-hydrolyzing) [Anaerolineaceae bacterium]|nr:asparagine synthase (glutamine-hydrolyzing) [Anaerolineaceae bacterium]